MNRKRGIFHFYWLFCDWGTFLYMPQTDMLLFFFLNVWLSNPTTAPEEEDAPAVMEWNEEEHVKASDQRSYYHSAAIKGSILFRMWS